MGIQGLFKFIQNATDNVHIKQFAGQTIAVDTYCWIHRGCFACADKLAMKAPTDVYVKYCMKYVDMLLKYNIRPVLVFDGCNLPSKEVTEQKRRQKRKEFLERGRQHLREGDTSAARDCFTKCVNVTPAMALEVIKAARKRSVDCIVAPYEADSQLAYLIKHGLVQAIITEDSDLLCFGCKKVIFKLDLVGNGIMVEMENLGRVKNLVGFTPTLFRQMCILSGCDYLESIKGVGLAKACKALKLSKYRNGYEVAKHLHQYIKGIQPPDPSYAEQFDRADKTFLYQIVFDPVQRKALPLNPYPPGVSSECLSFAGSVLNKEKAFQVALGNIDVNTHRRVNDFDVDKWLQKLGLMSHKSIWKRGITLKKPYATETEFSDSSQEVNTDNTGSALNPSSLSIEKQNVRCSKDTSFNQSNVLSSGDVLKEIQKMGIPTTTLSSSTESVTVSTSKLKISSSGIHQDDLSALISSYTPKKLVKKPVKSIYFPSPAASTVESVLDEMDKSEPEEDDATDDNDESPPHFSIQEIIGTTDINKLQSPTGRQRGNPFLVKSTQGLKRQSNTSFLQQFSHRKKKRLDIPKMLSTLPSSSYKSLNGDKTLIENWIESDCTRSSTTSGDDDWIKEYSMRKNAELLNGLKRSPESRKHTSDVDAGRITVENEDSTSPSAEVQSKKDNFNSAPSLCMIDDLVKKKVACNLVMYSDLNCDTKSKASKVLKSVDSNSSSEIVHQEQNESKNDNNIIDVDDLPSPIKSNRQHIVIDSDDEPDEHSIPFCMIDQIIHKAKDSSLSDSEIKNKENNLSASREKKVSSSKQSNVSKRAKLKHLGPARVSGLRKVSKSNKIVNRDAKQSSIAKFFFPKKN